MKNSFQKAKEDLEWLFTQSESEMGIKSNFSIIFYACLYATSKLKDGEFDSKAFNEAINQSQSHNNVLLATQKERKIYKRYQKLDNKSKMIIEAYYEPRKYSSELSKLFGPGIGVIPYTSIGLSFSQILLRESGKTFVQEFKNNKWQIRKEVDELYNQAVNNFANIK